MLVVELDLIDNPGILMKMLIYFLQAVLWMAVKHQDKRAIQVLKKATTTKENITTEMKVMKLWVHYHHIEYHLDVGQGDRCRRNRRNPG